jgi:F-type H+-transporting ATPase subunit alpha
LTELLKQPQFSPLKMEEQVAVIFAGTRGYLDAIPVSAVGKFEQGVLAGLRSEKTLLDTIAKEKALSGDSEKKLIEFLDKFSKGFAA